MSSATGNPLIGTCLKLLEFTSVPETHYIVTQQLSDWHIVNKDYDSALSVMTNALADNRLNPQNKAAVTAKAANLLSDQLNRPSAAIDILSSSINQLKDTPAATAPLLIRCADIHERLLNDPSKALADLQTVLAYNLACPGPDYTTAASHLADLQYSTDDSDQAAATLLLIIKHPAGQINGISQKLLGVAATSNHLEQALILLRTQINDSIKNLATFSTTLQRTQPEIVSLLIALGRAEEAVAECRAFAFVAVDRDYVKAIELAAQCLKACDGNLGRANALLAFHQQETPSPDTSNPLLSFKRITDPQRELLEKNSPMPATWNDWLDRAVLLLWLDHPIDAIDAARSAFSICPMTTDALKKCSDAIARPILVATRDTSLAQHVIDYLLYGSSGLDGQPDTDDDIINPFPEVHKRLTYQLPPLISPQP